MYYSVKVKYEHFLITVEGRILLVILRYYYYILLKNLRENLELYQK